MKQNFKEKILFKKTIFILCFCRWHVLVIPSAMMLSSGHTEQTEEIQLKRSWQHSEARGIYYNVYSDF